MYITDVSVIPLIVSYKCLLLCPSCGPSSMLPRSVSLGWSMVTSLHSSHRLALDRLPSVLPQSLSPGAQSCAIHLSSQVGHASQSHRFAPTPQVIHLQPYRRLRCHGLTVDLMTPRYYHQFSCHLLYVSRVSHFSLQVHVYHSYILLAYIILQ